MSRPPSRSPRGELIVAGALFAGAALAVAFVLLLAFDDDTQLLGLSLGLSLACLALASVVAGKLVVDQRKTVERRPQLVDEQLEHEVAGMVADAGQGISRRGLIAGAAAAAGTGVTAAAIAPLAGLGPGDVSATLKASPWRSGVPLVDEQGDPIGVDQLEVGSWLTAYPRGADPRQLGSSIVVVQVAAEYLDLPPERRDWAPRGIMAFSKICTHAGCAIALFRYPTYEPTSEPPALVCPCHYSTFDVGRAATVVFGPAGRPLPQLPLSIQPDETLVAAGGFSGAIGPAWWGVRRS
jgi:ubiquinol-cytochrome c reductase iron-sulfur subunit